MKKVLNITFLTAIAILIVLPGFRKDSRKPFKKNYKFKELNNADIYNLIYRILDITPAKNDWDPEHVEEILR